MADIVNICLYELVAVTCRPDEGRVVALISTGSCGTISLNNRGKSEIMSKDVSKLFVASCVSPAGTDRYRSLIWMRVWVAFASNRMRFGPPSSLDQGLHSTPVGSKG